jgi:glycosyltransferase involved in cell wall biosynthesis
VISGEYSSPEFRARFTQQARQAAERSDLIIAVSEFTANQVSSLLAVGRGRIRVIPHGMTPPPASALVRAREPLVLFVGALQARKNVTRLVEAFESLSEPWRLALAGATSGYGAAEILERISRSPSRSRIEITGYLDQQSLDALLARASIFAFPSLDEGFGIPVLEAMAWGVPVITSNRSALAEVAGDAALLVDPDCRDQIAAALERLAGRSDLRDDLIAAGKQRAAQFTWDAAVRQTYACYRELV